MNIDNMIQSIYRIFIGVDSYKAETNVNLWPYPWRDDVFAFSFDGHPIVRIYTGKTSIHRHYPKG